MVTRKYEALSVLIYRVTCSLVRMQVHTARTSSCNLGLDA